MIKYLKKGVMLYINDPNYINYFEKLKAIVTEAPALKYSNFGKMFPLIIDDSYNLLGSVLQIEWHPILFARRTLNDRELLAIVWASTYYRPFYMALNSRFCRIISHSDGFS